MDYLTLKESLVIFICPFDLFGRGLHKYTFSNICEELPELKLMDETKKVFLCAGGTADDVSQKMKNFLDYIVDNQAIGKAKVNELIQRLLSDNRVADLKRSAVEKEYQEKLMKEYGIE